MEKLIELLNEFDKPHYGQREYEERDQVFYSGEYDFYKDVPDYKLISKRYGFIKWLVDNDKIDNKKIPQFELVGWYTDVEYSEYENLLMVLAIQDEPIKFLCSILK